MSTDPIGIILEHEGGFVNHPDDRGGPTNFGITQKTYSSYLGRAASVQDVRAMTEETAREIYEKHYLYSPRINTLPTKIQAQILDIAVDHGPRNAIRLLQRVVNAAGFGPITVDGRMGPMTRSAVEGAETAMGNSLQNAVVEERVKFVHRIAERNPSQKVFLKGWIRRAESFRISV